MRRLFLILLLIVGCVASGNKSSDLTEAVRSGDVAAVKMLCARGVDPNLPTGRNGWAPLMHAVHKNQLGTAAALLAAGADPNRAAGGMMTPLMMAAGYGNHEMVALLLRGGAKASQADGEGSTALDYALTGMTDLDDFTYFKCQNETVSLLRPVSPKPQAGGLRWARLKGCA
jgi:ankyrin repeat protein